MSLPAARPSARSRLKQFLFRLLGKDPEGVVVSFLSGPEELARSMVEEVCELTPGRQHFAVAATKAPQIPGVIGLSLQDLPGPLRHKRIGLAPVLFTGETEYTPLRKAAMRLAPRKILAYNSRLERHHLRFSTPIASYLFWRGVPLDRIFVRPRWLAPWRRNPPPEFAIHEGRALSPERPRVAVLSPYFPYPLSHGGAVRIYHMLREASRDFDVFLFSFTEQTGAADLQPILAMCAKVVTVKLPRYAEPRWSTIAPPAAREFDWPVMRRLIGDIRSQSGIPIMQVEYTHMASYGGDVLVEHDVTFDLYAQILERERGTPARWNWWRWRRFEKRAVKKFRKVVVMSQKDAALLGTGNTAVIPNGVDLDRFQPSPESPAQRILFIGSFRHFPNVVAYRFFTEQVWPLVREVMPEAHFTAVAGPDAGVFWKEHNPDSPPYADERIERLGFVSDVRPLYAQANLVVVPTKVSAGTNLKVLEAMAMERAVLATDSGCAGLGLEHGKSVWIAESAPEFAQALVRLLHDPALRHELARNARAHVEKHFDWKMLGQLQKDLWLDLLPKTITVRTGRNADLPGVETIQSLSHLGSHWDAASYLLYDLRVAEMGSTLVGFMASRSVDDETEILNVAVHPNFRRRGVATKLITSIASENIFLEVRESNSSARTLYENLGFEAIGRRENYYDDPTEHGLVMRLSRKLKRVNF